MDSSLKSNLIVRKYDLIQGWIKLNGCNDSFSKTIILCLRKYMHEIFKRKITIIKSQTEIYFSSNKICLCLTYRCAN